jgi:hypothetical protein
LIRPVLLCSSKTWVMTKKGENRLFVLERKVFLTIYIVGVVKSNRLNYAGHMIKGTEDLLQRVVFYGCIGKQTKPRKTGN